MTVYEDDGQGRYVSQIYDAEVELDGIREAVRAALTGEGENADAA